MPRPYSKDLREKLFGQLDSGMSITEASRIFKINRQTIYNWRKIKKTTGTVEAKMYYQKGHSHKIKDMNIFKSFIDNNKDKSLKELARISDKYSAVTIWRGIRKLGYSYKKNFYAS